MRSLRVCCLILFGSITLQAQNADYDSTFRSNGIDYRIKRIQLEHDARILTINTSDGEVLRDTLEYSTDITLVDFDEDKSIDVVVNFMGNVDRQSLYLFDNNKKNFHKVIDFELYPEAQSIAGAQVYYAYHRSGCADAYWTSDLFTITDFKAIHLGQIFGNGCQEPLNVKIYKVERQGDSLVETLPYTIVTDDKDDKWGFIKAYWEKNFKKFI